MTTVWLDLWRDTVVVRRRFPRNEATAEHGPDADAAYRSRCRWLDRAIEHPVVRIVHRDPTKRIVSTAFVGSATLASRPLPAPDAARLIAALARVLHRLHADGLVHGALLGEHVIVSGNRFWLCGPAFQELGDLTPVVDVAALGQLVERSVAWWESPDAVQGLSIAEERRWTDLAAMAGDPSMSAARLAAKADRL